MRSYRNLLVMLLESPELQSGVAIANIGAQADIAAAMQWLKELGDEHCPEVNDEEIAENLLAFLMLHDGGSSND